MSFLARTAWHLRLPRRGAQRHLRSWLLDGGSLTTRLQRFGHFSVDVVAQGLSTPTPDEAQRFGLAPTRNAWIREVTLSIDSHPVVFAHTVLPQAPRGPVTRWLARLGQRSLGSMLFSRPDFSRGPLFCLELDRRHALHRSAITALGLSRDTPVWARRSHFRFGKQDILVTEVFSPALAAISPTAVTKKPQSASTGFPST